MKFLLECAIVDDDYLIQIASMRFDISSPEGKASAIAFLFPYIEVLESDIQRESAISKLSSAFGVSQQAIFSDYVNREKKALRHIVDEVKQKPVDIRMNAELRLVLAVTAKTFYIDTNDDGVGDTEATADSQNAELFFRANKGGRFRMELIDKPELRQSSIDKFIKGAESFKEL